MSFSHMGGGYLDSKNYEKDNQEPPEPERKPPTKLESIFALIFLSAVAYGGYRACVYESPKQVPTTRTAATQPASRPAKDYDSMDYLSELHERMDELRANFKYAPGKYLEESEKLQKEIWERRERKWKEEEQKQKEERRKRGIYSY